MNCELGRSIFRYLVGYSSGGIRVLPGRRRVRAPARDQRGR